MTRVAIACVLPLCTFATAESGQTNQSPQGTAARSPEGAQYNRTLPGKFVSW